ncbi:MFS transporter [Bacillus sp. FJAT-49711]|uniref:MFS transporter n=1 Tax=Bacillus sp. FJAT-49711 TaxID=2833585 RepID=UPI001BC9D14A|nr:MFS transporter [Bacillus sp. FJAT-49711]MBS4219824.1 MFS transporter [Bacillus sp. FJAT-49711]
MRIFVYMIVFFSFFDLFTQLPIMTPLATSLGATPFLTGLAVGMYSFSNTIGNVISGFLTDKKGPFVILLLGLIFTGAMLFSYFLAIDAWSLLLIRFLHGLTAGLIVPAAFTYLANSVKSEKKGKGAALSGAFVGLAAVIGPAFGGIVASKYSETTVLSVTAFFMILLGVLSLIFLRSKVIEKGSKGKIDTLSVKAFFKNSLIVRAFSGAFFLMFSQGVLAYMLPLKVMELGQDSQTSGLLLSTFGIVAILVFVLPINNLFDIIKPVKTATFGMAAMGVGLLLISFGNSIPFLYVVMGIYGIGFAFLFPSLNSLLIEATEQTHRGKAYGYFYAFFSIGVVFGSGLTGLLNLSANQGFLFTGVLLIGGASVMILLKNTSQPKKMELL